MRKGKATFFPACVFGHMNLGMNKVNHHASVRQQLSRNNLGYSQSVHTYLAFILNYIKKKPPHFWNCITASREQHQDLLHDKRMVKAGAKTGESLGQKVKRVHISHPKMLLNIPDTRTMWSNCRVESLTKIINCCLLVRTMRMRHGLTVAQECPNYRLNDMTVGFIMMTMLFMINEIILPIINTSSHQEVMRIMYGS